MRHTAEEMLGSALAAWHWEAPVRSAERYGNGHINDTFCVVLENGRRYILQRINTGIFTDPAGLMENICGVTAFLRKKIEAAGGDPERETMNVVPTAAGALILYALWNLAMGVRDRRRKKFEAHPEVDPNPTTAPEEPLAHTGNGPREP